MKYYRILLLVSIFICLFDNLYIYSSLIYCTLPLLAFSAACSTAARQFTKWQSSSACRWSLRSLTGRATLAGLERRASQLTGANVRTIRMSDAGIAYDIDDLENYRYLNKLDDLRSR